MPNLSHFNYLPSHAGRPQHFSQVIATKHAILRYRERIEKIPSARNLVCEHLRHAVEISRPATLSQIYHCSLKKSESDVYLWCPVEEFLICGVCEHHADGTKTLIVITVMRCPSEAEVIRLKRERQKRLHSEKRQRLERSVTSEPDEFLRYQNIKGKGRGRGDASIPISTDRRMAR